MITLFYEHYSFNVETIYSIRVSYDIPTIPNEKNFAYVESRKVSMHVDHEKNSLCDSYIVEFIHDATENYFERGIYAFTYLNNIKFPLYLLKVSKLYLFCLPMLVDSCSLKLCAHKIPRHRKWVRFKFCAPLNLNVGFTYLQQDHINFHPTLSKGLTWQFIETKAIKHDYYNILIMWTHKNSKGKYWVVFQQAFFFNAF